MIDASSLITNLVALLRDIPELASEMAGDAGRIYAYHDDYPVRVSLAQAIHEMPAPAIMAAWMGTAPGTLGGVDVWKHSVTLYVRAGESGGAPGPYCRILHLVTIPHDSFAVADQPYGVCQGVLPSGSTE